MSTHIRVPKQGTQPCFIDQVLLIGLIEHVLNDFECDPLSKPSRTIQLGLMHRGDPAFSQQVVQCVSPQLRIIFVQSLY